MSKLIISDIHGNLPALEAVLNSAYTNDISEVICLGDVTGYYPFINECIKLLESIHAKTILGNHDVYLLKNQSCPNSITVNKLLDYQKKIVNDNTLNYLASCDTHFISKQDLFVHGSIDNYTDGRVYEVKDDMLSGSKYSRIFVGHTHVQCQIALKDNKVFCNPGSVGQPRDGNPHAAFAIIKSDHVALHRVDYTKNIVYKKMSEIGFDEYTYKNLELGTRIGGKVDNIVKVL